MLIPKRLTRDILEGWAQGKEVSALSHIVWDAADGILKVIKWIFK